MCSDLFNVRAVPRRLPAACVLAVVISLAAQLLVASGVSAQVGLKIERTTTESLENPLGLDVAMPRLSWTLSSSGSVRGARQTAYRILVSSTRERLQRGEGDLWDSGRVESGASVLVPYGGRSLGSRQRAHWKVRVWDEQGRPSAWSEPALWTMGLLDRRDWQGQWIGPAAPRTSPPDPATLRIGHATVPALSSEQQETMIVDLGTPRRIDGIRLHPARRFVVGPWITHDGGYLFPKRFRVDVSDTRSFESPRLAVDHTGSDHPNPGIVAPTFRFEPTVARFVRLTVTRLRSYEARTHGAALAEIAVLRGAENVAMGRPVEASHFLEGSGWAPAYLTDGRDVSDSPYPQNPVIQLRREFSVRRHVRRATLYATALGVYQLRINGRPVDGRRLAPEWTRYDDHVQYQTYDVTPLLRDGRNVVAALLGEGWYAGRVLTQPKVPTVAPRLLVQFEMELSDGSRETIVSDGQWRATDEGPIRFAGIYDGEIVDARRAMPGWDLPGFVDRSWAQVSVSPVEAMPRLVAQRSQPILVTAERRAEDVRETAPGVYVYDFGQNMVGGMRLHVRGRAGDELLLRPAERLNPDGTPFYNLKGGTSALRYTLRGDADGESYEPHFSYFGFRYVEVRGLPRPPEPGMLTGLVFHTAARPSGRFASSDARLNALMSAIAWTLRGNLMGVPTDCPQRDERLGWMGDVQAAAGMIPFFWEADALLANWLREVRAAQDPAGRFGDMSPQMFGPGLFYGSPGWGDAGVVVPWAIYLHYGDRRIIEENYDSAKRWVDWIHTQASEYLWRAAGPGDWLNGDRVFFDTYPRSGGAVADEIFATAFFAHSADLVARMARVLERHDEEARYRRLHGAVVKAFAQAFVDKDGVVRGGTQAGYALALHFGLVPESLRARALHHMVEAFRPYDGHLSTGIQATHRLMLELSRGGRHDVALELLSRRTPPSWGYMLDQGATTIWERWDSWVDGRDTQPDWMGWMNSFNHVAFGAVGEWVWQELVGLRPDETAPGFAHFYVAPRPGGGLAQIDATFTSPRGEIRVDWTARDGTLTLSVAVPVNSTATIVVPAAEPYAVRERGAPLDDALCTGGARPVAGGVACQVGSGRFEFTAPMTGKTETAGAIRPVQKEER